MLRRFSLYGFGFAIGLIILAVVLNGKNASCNFLPNERVLNILRNKPCQYADEVVRVMTENKIDSTEVLKILLEGDVDFSKSKTHEEPCRYYWIDGLIRDKKTALYVENCEEQITIQHLYLEKE